MLRGLIVDPEVNWGSSLASRPTLLPSTAIIAYSHNYTQAIIAVEQTNQW